MAKALEDRISEFISRLSKTKTLRSGHIALHFIEGKSEEHYFITTEPGAAALSRDLPPTQRSFEIIGNRDRILSVLEGSKDAAVQFATGAFRIRGNLIYMRALATELGLLKTGPFAANTVPFSTFRSRGG